MVLSHVEPLTEQQIVGVYGLQQSALETEEALSQGLEALYQSLLQAMRSETCRSVSEEEASQLVRERAIQRL